VQPDSMEARAGEPATYLQWAAVVSGALLASALLIVLLAFGSAIGLAVVSPAPSWRDSSAALALLSGLFLILASLASFGAGAYVAGRLRTRWSQASHSDEVEFRDGMHGLLVWAAAVVITTLVAAAVTAATAPPALTRTAAPERSTGETLVAYELDRLFRAQQPPDGDFSYGRAEASRILLAAASRRGVGPEDRVHLVRLVGARTGIAQSDAERRVDIAIAEARTAVSRARRAAVLVGFSSAVALLLGAAVSWFAASVGGRHRDDIAPPLTWPWPFWRQEGRAS
jgi:hypothetical protein